MGDNTGIEWTDATWNPVVGCTIVSPGCTNCYAMKQAARMLDGNPKAPHYEGTTKRVNGNAVWTGKVAMAPDHILTAPLRWKKPRRIFVNSMGDLFHESVPDAWIDRVFAVMALAPQHVFQVLTKWSKRMREYCNDHSQERRNGRGSAVVRLGGITDGLKWPLDNCWLGVSVEDQARADERIPDLLSTPAAVRFVSAEPLLGTVDLTRIDPPNLGSQVNGLTGRSIATRRGQSFVLDVALPGGARLDWIIAGGESGPGARPMHPQWARALRDQCVAAGVAFFMKQWGEWAPYEPQPGGDLGGDIRGGTVTIVHPSGRDAVAVAEATGGRSTEPGSRYMKRVGKASAGRLLDGREHNDMPEKEK